MRRTLASRSTVILAAGGVRLPSEDIMLAGRRNLQAQAGAGQAGQQVGGMLQQLAPMLAGSGSAAGAAGAGAAAGAAGGAAGAASALGPIGMAVAAGSAVNGMITKATTDENGFAKTGTGATIARSLGSSIDPIGTIMSGVSNLQRDDLSTVQKIGSFIPGASALVTRGADERARKKFERLKMQQEISAGVMANQEQNYQGVQFAAEGVKLPITSVRRLADGGKPVAKKPQPAPVPGNSEQAEQYYKNVLPTIGGLLNKKYDETYIDPQTGKTCTANSCLSFATTVAEQALGEQRGERTRANLYNPEFTRTSEQQGWVRVPLDQAKAGDRLQYWNAEGNVANGVDRSADLGGRQYIPGKYPSHMMVFGGWKGEDGQGRKNAVVYNDGHEFDKADRDVRGSVDDSSYVAYRFIGVNGKPTNNPQQAIAVNPAVRKDGGKVPEAFADGGVVKKPASTTTQDYNPTPVRRSFSGKKPRPTTAYDRNRENAYQVKEELETARSEQKGKEYLENGLNLVGLLRGTPAAPIGWAAAGLGAMIDGNDSRKAYQAGNTGEAVAEGIGAAVNVLPLNFSSSGKVGNVDLLKRGSRALVKRQVNNGAYRTAAGAAAATDGTDFGQMLGNTFKFEQGGALEVAVIASGALHSEKHGLADGDVGTHGIPILDVTGKRKAELERDELTLPLSTTQQLEKLRSEKNYLAMGELMQRQIKESTVPSKRFARRLASGGTLEATPVTADHTMLMLGEDGQVQMPLHGEERIISREHTRELVQGSLKSASPVQLRKLGRRVATIFNGHDRRAVKTS